MTEFIVGKIEQLSEQVSNLDTFVRKKADFPWAAYVVQEGGAFIIHFPDAHMDADYIKGESEKETMTRFLYAIAEYFSTHDIAYNKWGKDNLRISWDKPGGKV